MCKINYCLCDIFLRVVEQKQKTHEGHCFILWPHIFLGAKIGNLRVHGCLDCSILHTVDKFYWNYTIHIVNGTVYRKNCRFLRTWFSAFHNQNRPIIFFCNDAQPFGKSRGTSQLLTVLISKFLISTIVSSKEFSIPVCNFGIQISCLNYCFDVLTSISSENCQSEYRPQSKYLFYQCITCPYCQNFQ